jgi:hypothetical protein
MCHFGLIILQVLPPTTVSPVEIHSRKPIDEPKLRPTPNVHFAPVGAHVCPLTIIVREKNVRSEYYTSLFLMHKLTRI